MKGKFFVDKFKGFRRAMSKVAVIIAFFVFFCVAGYSSDVNNFAELSDYWDNLSKITNDEFSIVSNISFDRDLYMTSSTLNGRNLTIKGFNGVKVIDGNQQRGFYEKMSPVMRQQSITFKDLEFRNFLNPNYIAGYEVLSFVGTYEGNVNFISNKTDGNGGAIYAGEGSTINFNNTISNFIENEAEIGGGSIFVGKNSYVYGNQATINFVGNIAKGDGGVIFATSGYHHIQFSSSTVKFENNNSDNNGGAIFLGSTSYVPMSFAGGEVAFVGNNANNNGGAIFMKESSGWSDKTVLLENVTFINNTAGSKGGVIYLSSFTKITIKARDKDVIFSGNKANGQDNDIHFDNQAGLFFEAASGKKIEIHGGISGVGSSSITKTGAGTLILGGNYNLPTKALEIKGGDVKAIGQQLVFNELYVESTAKYSMKDDNAVQITSVSNTYIYGTIELDVDFGLGQSDKLYASNIYFSTGSIISINAFGSGYENEIMIVFGDNNSNSVLPTISFGGGLLGAMQYRAQIGVSSITVRARSVNSVETPTELRNEMESDNFLIEFTIPNIALNDTEIKTGVVYGNGNSVDGDGGKGLSIKSGENVEFNNLNVKNFVGDTAIAVGNGSVLKIVADSKDVSFAGNKEDLSLTKEAIVNIETSNNHNVSFGSGISGDVGSKIDKKGDGTLVLDGNVAFSGTMNIGKGVVQITAEEVFISTLVVSNGGIYSTADGKTHTTNVDKADISGTLEIGLNADGADLIIVSNAIVVNSESVWNITPFGKGIKVDDKGIALMITSGTVIGEVNDTPYTINNLTYQIFVVNKSPGGGLVVNPSDYDYSGIYLRIIDVLNELGIGLNGAFIANSIRLGALSNNGNVYANIHNDVWVAGVANGQNLTDSVNKDFESNGYGVQAGAMIYLDENRTRTMTGGLFAGFNTKSLKEGEDKADANDIELGTYWGYKTQKVNVMGSLSGGFQSISAKNEEAKAKADFNTYSIRLGAEAEYLLGIWKPYIGIAGGYVSSGKIEEKIDGKVKGTIDADSYLRLETIAGIKIEKEVGSTLLSAKAHLGYLAVGEKPEYKAEDVTIYGTKEDPLSAGVGIGIEYAVSKKVSIFLNGDTNFGKDLFGYYGNLGGRYKF